jgi:hypothetical protein
MRFSPPIFALLLAALALSAQNQPDSAHREWQASWITHPAIPLREPVVRHFRRALELASIPPSYPVRVSADNRFILKTAVEARSKCPTASNQ